MRAGSCSSCTLSLWSPSWWRLRGVMRSSAVPEGLMGGAILLCGCWKPISSYWGRICVMIHSGMQVFQPGASRIKNSLGPPISTVFMMAMASRFCDRGFSHTSNPCTCTTTVLFTVELHAENSSETLLTSIQCRSKLSAVCHD